MHKSINEETTNMLKRKPLPSYLVCINKMKEKFIYFLRVKAIFKVL